ncbi:MAG: 30S ribosomal protein S5 [Methanobacteriota archaeon]|nr:MAG: 30S ribosomal protein S5 [Euryarchaeota archaeon]
MIMDVNWEPKTKLGLAVKNGEITSIDSILMQGKPIMEAEIVDVLLPDLKSETMELRMTQRVTDSGRKGSFRAVVIVGDGQHYVGVGVAKATEAAKALNKALERAKRAIIKVPSACGSWECQCGGHHSIPKAVSGKESSSFVEIKPAPRGVGLAANDTVKKVLQMAGISDAWAKARGSTNNVYNMLLATLKALNSLNRS